VKGRGPGFQVFHGWRVVPDLNARQLEQWSVTAERRPVLCTRASELWLEQPLDDRWMSALRIVYERGRLRIGELRIFPIEELADRVPGEWSGTFTGLSASVPRRGLTKALVSRVRLHEWTTRTVTDRWIGTNDLELVLEQPAENSPSANRRGRPAMPDSFYAEVARAYVTALEQKKSPIQAIARDRQVPEARVRGWVHRARRHGLLRGRGQGKAQGVLSDRARSILGTTDEKPKKHKRR